ncbi:MAG: hypothetical protein JTT11_10720 [Candidatus Brockarchaeota archaeon]|nr:hypothetical protein [Candidatus Brockarchaeota archaeon]
MGSSSDSFWSIIPLPTKRLLYSSVAWSFCSIAILVVANLAGKLFAMHEVTLCSLFVMTVAALCGGAFFLVRLLKLSLSIFKGSKKR